ncbi:MAG: TRAP transporter large permease [Defluviitaleaceae bacterium]|nr:TRAP transporter large permease [Defluviitaleaceae bacterium]
MFEIGLIFVVLLGLIFLGLPVFLATLVTGIIFLVADGIPMSVVIIRMFGSINSLALMAIPFFIIAGNIILHSGITERLMQFANACVGFLKGGMGHVNIMTSVLFSGKQGSGVADAATTGSILIPAMEKEGYDKGYAVAVTAASAMIAPVTPPSIAMILYAYYTGVPVAFLFMAGIIPGILLACFQLITNSVMYRVYKYNIPTTPFSLKNLLVTAYKSVGALLMPAIIIIGVTTGFVSATESGVIAIVYGLFYGFLVTKKLKVDMLPKILLQSAITSAVVMMAIAATGVLGNVFVRMHFQAQMLNFALYTIGTPLLAVFFIMGALIIIGLFLDPTVIIAMFAMTIFTIGNALGFDPVHFGIVMILVMQLGAITPPAGSFLFVACSIGNLPLEKSIKPLLPYIGVILLLILVLLFIPQLVTLLPSIIFQW